VATQAELQNDLDSINTLIGKIEAAQTQEFWDNGYRHRAPELPALYTERRKLREDIGNKSRSASRVRRVSFVR